MTVGGDPVNRSRPITDGVGSPRAPADGRSIVNYECWPDVVRLVGLAARPSPSCRSGACEIVVVDNASRGPIPAASSRTAPPGLRLVARPDNGGFAAGVNAGWRAARAAGSWSSIPMWKSPAGSSARSSRGSTIYEADPDGPPGIVGFGLRNPDGSPQGSVGAFPTLARSIREQFIPRSRRKYQPGWRIRPGRVDWVTGACMLVNAEMIADVGGMDEDFFLYHEEVAFSRVARRSGLAGRI